MDFDELAELRHLDQDDRDDDPCEYCGQYEPHCTCEEENA
tara:strand:- start:1181 stop:1300 length:120 start_codon:yes stop_codon:yes gene_type:complete